MESHTHSELPHYAIDENVIASLTLLTHTNNQPDNLFSKLVYLNAKFNVQFILSLCFHNDHSFHLLISYVKLLFFPVEQKQGSATLTTIMRVLPPISIIFVKKTREFCSSNWSNANGPLVSSNLYVFCTIVAV